MTDRRIAVTTALAAWGALFWWLLLTGRSSLYLSSRTAWVIPVGAALLTVAAAGRLAFGRSGTLDAREAWALAVIVLPVVVVAALPPASLGSFAAGRRSTFATANFSGSPGEIADGEITLVDLAGAMQSRKEMRALTRRAGAGVEFTGIVVRDEGMPADEFTLTRFIVACCVADALSVQVRVVGVTPGRFIEDDWVRVTGRLYPLGADAVVQAEQVVKVDRPNEPYITP